jgi:glycosyltransferase involved in cell wall biosynthesis
MDYIPAIRKKVLVISEYELHKGMGAAYERIKCYSKAVSDVDFFCLNPFADYSQELSFSLHSGSDNLFFHKQNINKESFIYRNFLKFFDFFRPGQLAKYILKKYPKENIKILLYSSHLPLFAIVILFIGWSKKYTVIVEKNELERGIVQNIPKPEGFLRIIFYILYPLRYYSSRLIDEWLTSKASALITISSKLMKKYHNQTECTLIPILVDNERFQQNNELQSDIVRFIYLGSIYQNKDCLYDILETVNIISKNFKLFRIDIIGPGNKNSLRYINSYINRNDLNSFVRLMDPIGNSQVPNVLNQYDFGLLLRNNNTQTEYGFSTKLGEYLAAGLPVIYTDVSDNSFYLKDNVHGYLVPFSIRENLVNIFERANLTTYTQRLQMKNEAKQLAMKEFKYSNYSVQLERIFA